MKKSSQRLNHHLTQNKQGYWLVRNHVNGVRVSKSTRTKDVKEARVIRDRIIPLMESGAITRKERTGDHNLVKKDGIWHFRSEMLGDKVLRSCGTGSLEKAKVMRDKWLTDQFVKKGTYTEVATVAPVDVDLYSRGLGGLLSFYGLKDLSGFRSKWVG